MKATRKCSFCGKSFVTRSGMQRYCSEACQAEAKRARVMQKNNLFKVAQPLMEIQHQEYLTFSKAAILMGCSRQYIYKLVAIGKLKASRISNRMHSSAEPTSSRCWRAIPITASCPATPPHQGNHLHLPYLPKEKKGKRKAKKCWTSIRARR